MGIHGLTSFIDNNPHLLKDRELHDCRVVIDGNNFYHFLYFYCNVNFQFGGDYDTYLRKIRSIFSMFKTCNIEVFVVFDGAYTLDGKKFQTTFGRARDRVMAAKRIMYGHRGTLIPCLAQVTFRQALDDIGVQHVTCDFEADNQLASLANRWNCPVISNDSDFYIFDMSGGFIPLDYIDFRPHELPEKSRKPGHSVAFLPVQFYHVDDFISCFRSLNRSVLPLFATMLGNDYVNASAFELFYRKKTPKIASQRYSAAKKHQKIVSVLYWLEEKGHKAELVSEVLSFINPLYQKRIEKLLTDSINGYIDTQNFESFDLARFFEEGRTAAKEKADVLTSLRGYNLPAWFVAACRSGEIPAFLLNAVLQNRVILPTQVESVPLPASFLVSCSIREVSYGLLLGQQLCSDQHEQVSMEDSTCAEKEKSENSSVDTENTSLYRGAENSTPASLQGSTESSGAPGYFLSKKVSESVVEYTRFKQELRKIPVYPLRSLLHFGNIPELELIPSLPKQDRQTILLETVGVSREFITRFDPSLQLFAACLVFWAKHAEPAVSVFHLKGILLSALLLHVHREIAERKNELIDKGINRNKHCAVAACVGASGDVMKSSADSTEVKGLISHGDLDGQSPKTCKTAVMESSFKDGSISADDCHAKANDKCILSISGACHSAPDKLLERTRDNLKKYYHEPSKISSKNPPDQETYHGTAQFQACLLDASYLNSLLQCPMSPAQPAVLINGSFVYTIVQELKARSNPDLFLAEMLVKGSVLVKLFDSLCHEIVQETGCSKFSQPSAGKKCCKNAKKRKRKEKEGASDDRSKVASSDGSACSKKGQTMLAACSLTNRFGALVLEDDS